MTKVKIRKALEAFEDDRGYDPLTDVELKLDLYAKFIEHIASLNNEFAERAKLLLTIKDR